MKDKNGGFSSRLIKIDRPLLRVPSLAIHRECQKYLRPIVKSDPSSVERGSGDNFTFNQETEMLPILGMAEEQLNAATEKAEKNSPAEVKATDVRSQHHTALLEVLSQELSVVPEDIHDFEL